MDLQISQIGSWRGRQVARAITRRNEYAAMSGECLPVIRANSRATSRIGASRFREAPGHPEELRPRGSPADSICIIIKTAGGR